MNIPNPHREQIQHRLSQNLSVCTSDENIRAKRFHFVDMLTDATYTGADVEVDGKLITANGPKSALDFSVAIAKALGLEPKI